MKNTHTSFLIAITVCLIAALAIWIRGNQAYQGITWSFKRDARIIENLDKDCLIRHSSGCKNQPLNLSVNLGVYDPKGIFDNSQKFALQHEFISWATYDSKKALSFFNKTATQNRWPILTIEPYPIEPLKKENILVDVYNKKYDVQIDRICTDIELYGKPVFLRWGHEMENVTGRYPWAQKDYIGYIAAYKHVVDQCRKNTTLVYFVWSPVGNKNLKDYWPGREYVDYIGLSLFIYPEWEKIHYGRVRSFSEILSEKYTLVKGYDRPVMIAEFGYKGNPVEQKKIILEGFSHLGDFPLIKTVSFFNEYDTEGVWGNDLPNPDWKIQKSLLDEIVPTKN